MKFTVPGIGLDKRKKRETIERISWGRLLVYEGCRVRGMQSAYTTMTITFLLNFQPAQQFIQRFFEKRGVKLSRTCLFIKASAIALKRHPWMNDMLSATGTRVVKSSSIDIGVCVQGQENFPQFMVLQDADKINFIEISEWLRNESTLVRENEKNVISSLNRLGWLLPFPVLRRLFLKYYINNHRVRRNLVGTFLLSMLHGREVLHASFQSITPTAFMIVGGVSHMPFDIQGEQQWLPAVYFTLNADHRMVDGMRAINFGKDIVRILEHPEMLEDL